MLLSTIAPTASLVSESVHFKDQYMQVTVRYSDNVGINASSLGNGDLLLTGPNGYSQAAVLDSWTRGAAGGVLGVYGFRSPARSGMRRTTALMPSACRRGRWRITEAQPTTLPRGPWAG